MHNVVIASPKIGNLKGTLNSSYDQNACKSLTKILHLQAFLFFSCFCLQYNYLFLLFNSFWKTSWLAWLPAVLYCELEYF